MMQDWKRLMMRKILLEDYGVDIYSFIPWTPQDSVRIVESPWSPPYERQKDLRRKDKLKISQGKYDTWTFCPERNSNRGDKKRPELPRRSSQRAFDDRMSLLKKSNSFLWSFFEELERHRERERDAFCFALLDYPNQYESNADSLDRILRILRLPMKNQDRLHFAAVDPPNQDKVGADSLRNPKFSMDGRDALHFASVDSPDQDKGGADSLGNLRLPMKNQDPLHFASVDPPNQDKIGADSRDRSLRHLGLRMEGRDPLHFASVDPPDQDESGADSRDRSLRNLRTTKNMRKAVPELLLETLEDLLEEDLHKFHWYLNEGSVLNGFPHIPKSQLENASRWETVDKMVLKYQKHGAVDLTLKILSKINQNQLALDLRTKIEGTPFFGFRSTTQQSDGGSANGNALVREEVDRVVKESLEPSFHIKSAKLYEGTSLEGAESNVGTLTSQKMAAAPVIDDAAASGGHNICNKRLFSSETNKSFNEATGKELY
uniref:Uncharacterized LOC111193496 n=1 Tax=Astyanax mexicanus TaxID=7994 RepID=A0A3B1J6S4_ASTMX